MINHAKCVLAVVLAAMVLSSCEDTTIIDDTNDQPRVIGAISTSNTAVRVSFSDPMGDTAIDSRNYSIVASNINPEAAAVAVVAAEFGATRDIVNLTTMSQSSVEYDLKVIGARNQDGEPLAPPTASAGGTVDPSKAKFWGTGPSASDLVDTDGDGLTDNEEQIGWTVVFRLSNGTEVSRDVTSDPTIADTDNDGLNDLQEQRRSTDPRDADTDGDTIEDPTEIFTYFTSALNQDTDGDGVNDASEITFFKTSPIFADTDGDQIPDGEETILPTRDPRIADLPRPRIRIGNVNLQLDVRLDYTSTQGMSESESKSVSSALTQSQNQTFATSDSDTTKSTIEVTDTLKSTFDLTKGGGSVEASVSLKAGLEQGHTSSFSEESSEGSEQSYEDSLTTSATRDVSESVTRTVQDAAMLVDVSVANVSDIAFSISNLELTALAQDPNDRRKMVPIATLTSDTLTDLNLGALGGVSERGPIVFQSDQVFPRQIEDLMKNPRGLIVQLANFDIQDESGRNFAFTSQEVFDKTAGIVIDYGDGSIETFRVATNSTFDQDGNPMGITMSYALNDILDLTQGEPDGYETELAERTINGEVRQVEILTRIKGSEAGVTDLNPDDLIDESRTFWIVFGSNGIDNSIDFNDIPLRAGEQFALTFVQDQDADEVIAREEELFGSSDLLPNTDGCPDDDPDTPVYEGTCARDAYDLLNDRVEAKEGWLVRISGNSSQNRRVYADPRQPDSDLDGVMDDEEFNCALDPRQKDTDLDGLSDFDEIWGGYAIRTDGGIIVTRPPQYSGAAILDGGNQTGDTVPAGDDVIVLAPGQPTANPGAVVLLAGPNGVLDTAPGGDDFVAAEHDVVTTCIPTGLTAAVFATDPLNPDTDFDGIEDGAEEILGINPNDPRDGAAFIDTDQDGVADAREVDGFLAYVNNLEVRLFSDPDDPDSDNDRLPDLLEHKLGSDPFSADTDNDGLVDFDEYIDMGAGEACVTEVPGVACEPGSFLRIADGYQEFVDECDEAPACDFSPQTLIDFGSRQYGTNLNERDTDFEGLTDPVELEGYTIDGSLWAEPDSPVIEVFPSPWLADADMDNWSDFVERSNGTDPNNRDTDGDMADDFVEFSICTSGWCRNPRIADRVIEFRYTSLRIEGDCDILGNDGEFKWSLKVDTNYPDRGFLVRNPGGDDDDRSGRAVDNSETINLVAGLDWNIVARFGQQFALAGFLQEIDPGGADASLRWAPDGCTTCSFLSDLGSAQHANTVHTVNNELASAPPVGWQGTGSCGNIGEQSYSWTVSARMRVR